MTAPNQTSVRMGTPAVADEGELLPDEPVPTLVLIGAFLGGAAIGLAVVVGAVVHWARSE